MISEIGPTLLLDECRGGGGYLVALDEPALLALFNAHQLLQSMGDPFQEISMHVPDGACVDLISQDPDDNPMAEGLVSAEQLESQVFETLLPPRGQDAVKVSIRHDIAEFSVPVVGEGTVTITRSFDDIWRLVAHRFDWVQLIAPEAHIPPGKAFSDFALKQCAEAGLCPNDSDPDLLVEPTGAVLLREIDRSSNEARLSVGVRYDMALALSELELAVRCTQRDCEPSELEP